MKTVLLSILLPALIVLPQTAGAGRSDRGDILDAMNEFLTVYWYSAEDACLDGNLLHPNYNVSTCDGTSYDQHHCSDFLWHPDYLNDDMGTAVPFSAEGMPYLYGGNTYPNEIVDDACNCYALGAHSCHRSGNGNDVSWATGTDCSASVSYALDISRVGTWSLDSDSYGVVIGWDDVTTASYLVVGGSHVVLVEDNWYGSLTILESTGAYPVARRLAQPDTYYISRGYTPRDPIDVANNNPVAAASGRILAETVSGGVEILVDTKLDPAAELAVVRRPGRDVTQRTWCAVDFSCTAAAGGNSQFRLLDADPVGWPRVYDLMLTEDGRTLLLDSVDLNRPPAAPLALDVSPNPFNPVVNIRFSLPRPGRALLRIYDMRGRLVRTLLDQDRPGGSDLVVWSGDDQRGHSLASGVYLVLLTADERRVEERIALVR